MVHLPLLLLRETNMSTHCITVNAAILKPGLAPTMAPWHIITIVVGQVWLTKLSR